MKIATINGIDNFSSYMINVAGNPELQPEIIMTTVHDGYIEYGADLIIDRMKSHSMYDRYDDHHVRFAVDGMLNTCVQFDFTGSFDDEQYKVIKALAFMWYKILFNTLSNMKGNGELLMKEMDQDYYERNIKLLSEINIK